MTAACPQCDAQLRDDLARFQHELRTHGESARPPEGFPFAGPVTVHKRTRAGNSLQVPAPPPAPTPASAAPTSRVKAALSRLRFFSG